MGAEGLSDGASRGMRENSENLCWAENRDVRRNAGVTEHSHPHPPSLRPGPPKPLRSHCSGPQFFLPRHMELQRVLERRRVHAGPPERQAHGVLSVAAALSHGHAPAAGLLRHLSVWPLQRKWVWKPRATAA